MSTKAFAFSDTEKQTIGKTDDVKSSATRQAWKKSVDAGDALHLTAAIVAWHFEPNAVRFLSEDVHLKEAAEREGFVVGL
jgi:hypothetical protein